MAAQVRKHAQSSSQVAAGDKLRGASSRSEPSQSATIKSRLCAIGSFFESFRLKAGFSLAQVADALGLDGPHTVDAYEKGLQQIPLEDVFALTTFLNIPPEDVLVLIHEVYKSLEQTS